MKGLAYALGDAWDWICEHWILLLIGLAIIGLIVVLATAEPRKYIQAPIESCRQARTGNKHTYDVANTTCASYDKNGVCTVPVTTYTQQTDVEVRVTCDFTEWRTE